MGDVCRRLVDRVFFELGVVCTLFEFLFVVGAITGVAFAVSLVGWVVVESVS